jgi:hypothetical protein
VSQKDTIARSLHDLGLASWFGGSLMGAVGLNAAAGEVAESRQRARVANEGWARWTPVNAAAIGAHVLGAIQLTWANKGRIVAQRGVKNATYAKSAMTLAALAVTAYSRVLGKRMQLAGDVPVEGGTEPAATTPQQVAQAQRQLRVLQWAIPALTGGALIVNSVMGEQQRPKRVGGGIFGRVVPGR